MSEHTSFDYVISSDPLDDILLAEIRDHHGHDVLSVGLSGNTKEFWYWLGIDHPVGFEDKAFQAILRQAKDQLVSDDAKTARDESWDYVTFEEKSLAIELITTNRDLQVSGAGRILLDVSFRQGQKIWTLYPSSSPALLAGKDFDRILRAVADLTILPGET